MRIEPGLKEAELGFFGDAGLFRFHGGGKCKVFRDYAVFCEKSLQSITPKNDVRTLVF